MPFCMSIYWCRVLTRGCLFQGCMLFLMYVIYALFLRWFLPYSPRVSKSAKTRTQSKKIRVKRYLFHSMLHPCFPQSSGVIAWIITMISPPSEVRNEIRSVLLKYLRFKSFPPNFCQIESRFLTNVLWVSPGCCNPVLSAALHWHLPGSSCFCLMWRRIDSLCSVETEK